MAEDKKIAYTVQQGNTVQFFNKNGQYIWQTLGECVAYT